MSAGGGPLSEKGTVIIMKKRKGFPTAAVVLIVLLCTVMLSGCGGDKTAVNRAMPGEVSYIPTVFVSDNGLIRFLYDSENDMLSTLEGCDIASLYDGGSYSMLVSYQAGRLGRTEADDMVKAEFSDGVTMELTGRTKRTEISGHTFRRAAIRCTDGSYGAVCYGNTETGFAEIYYIVAPDAPEGTEAHVEELISTVVLGEYTGAETEDIRIYVD